MFGRFHNVNQVKSGHFCAEMWRYEMNSSPNIKINNQCANQSQYDIWSQISFFELIVEQNSARKMITMTLWWIRSTEVGGPKVRTLSLRCQIKYFNSIFNISISWFQFLLCDSLINTRQYEKSAYTMCYLKNCRLGLSCDPQLCYINRPSCYPRVNIINIIDNRASRSFTSQ